MKIINVLDIANFLKSKFFGFNFSIERVSSLDKVSDNVLVFSKGKKLEDLTSKCLVLVPLDFEYNKNVSYSIIKVENPRLGFAKVVNQFFINNHNFGISKTVKNGFLLPSKKFIYAIHLISILGIFLVIWAYSSTMSLVGFDQVYELRSEANSLSKGFLVDYFLVWITFLSIPFYTSMSIIKKDFKYALIAVFISILIYSAQGAKIAALSILIILAIFILTKIKGDILKKLLVSSSIIFMVLASLPDDGIYMWIKSILMVRIYSNAGWALVTYYEYFTTHIHTYYTHIGPINMIFNSYPYGNYSLGQLIGIQYFGSEKVNFNANFWASDGLAAIGNYGLIIISFIISVYFFILNRITSKFSHIFLYMFCSGFLMAMQNLPFTTSLLSGGALFILFMFIFFKIH